MLDQHPSGMLKNLKNYAEKSHLKQHEIKILETGTRDQHPKTYN